MMQQELLACYCLLCQTLPASCLTVSNELNPGSILSTALGLCFHPRSETLRRVQLTEAHVCTVKVS